MVKTFPLMDLDMVIVVPLLDFNVIVLFVPDWMFSLKVTVIVLFLAMPVAALVGLLLLNSGDVLSIVTDVFTV